MAEFTWDLDVEELVATAPRVEVVTEDGVYRKGTLSAVLCDRIAFMGHEVPVPREVELNGDPESRFPVTRIRTVTEIDD